MRHLSLKRQRQQRRIQPMRDDFMSEFPVCMCCEQNPSTDCHEIARGAARQRSVAERCAWLAVCRDCHRKLNDYSQWPIERQLLVKDVKDPAYYDLKRVNELRGRDRYAIEEIDLKIWAVRFLQTS